MLNLTRPLAFIDLETTGTDVAKDRIVEISILKLFSGNRSLSGAETNESEAETNQVRTWRVNPGIPIPSGASKVHGIFDKDIAAEPLFAQIANDVFNLLDGADLAGFNSNNFDIPLLAEEFLRVGIEFGVKERKLVDIQSIYRKMEPRNLGAAYRFYCGKDIQNAHSAEGDVTATFEILQAQIERYPELKNSVDFLAEFAGSRKNADMAGRIVFDENGVEVFNFGKHKGKPVEDVFRKEPSYYSWMNNGDFPLYTKRVITEIYKRSRISKPENNKLF